MSDWKEYKLGDIASVQTGPFGSQLHQEDYAEFGTPIITVEHLGDNRVTYQNLPKVTDKDKERLKKYWLQTGDVVFSRVGSVDRRAYVTEKENGWLFSGRCLRVRANEQVANGQFLSYYFGQESFKAYVRRIAVGATMPSINTKILSDIEIILPDLQTQRATAEILSSLDDKIELNNQINANLEALAQAIFEDVFAQADCDRLVTIEHYIDFNPAVRIKKGSPTTFVEMKFLPTSGMNVTAVDQKPFTAGSRFMQNDTLLARITPCLENGKTAFVNFLEDNEAGFGSTEFIVMRAKTTACPQLVYCLARNQQFRTHAIGSMVGSSGRQRVQQDMLVKFTVPLVDSKEMNKFYQATEPLFMQINANRVETAELAKLRDLLLPKLLSGQISIE